MKTTTIFTCCRYIGITLCLLSNLLILSCSKLSIKTDSLPYNQWLKEVNHALDISKHANCDEQIRLIDYNYIGIIDSENDVTNLTNEIFSDNAYILFNNIEAKSSALVTWGDEKIFTKEHRAKMKTMVESRINIGETEIVELIWLYKDQTYTSMALASRRDGIIYDNIATYAINYDIKKDALKHQYEIRRPLTRAAEDELKNLNVADSIAADTAVRVFSVSDMSDIVEMITGKYAWRYSIKVVSAFNRHGYLVYRDLKADSDCAFGWKCDADAKTVSGDLFTSQYHEFAWAWAYGNSSTSINISFVGNGFTISGGDRKSHGTQIHYSQTALSESYPSWFKR